MSAQQEIHWFYWGPGAEMYTTTSKSFAGLFGDVETARFVVPRFQRGYSWERKHIRKFWEDLQRYERESGEKNGPEQYFLGPIVLMPDPNVKNIIYVLDGQQRLATVTIIFSVIRDALANLGTSDAKSAADDIQNHLICKEDSGYCLELGELDKAHFIDTVQSFPVKDREAKLRSRRNIQKAREIIAAEIAARVSPLDPVHALESLRKLRKIVRNDLILACIEVKSQKEAFRIFETLNDRGLRLSTPDLLLNYLMGEAADDSTRDVIRTAWNEMLHGMGRRDINRFFRHMWVSKYGDLKSIDLFSALSKHIEKKELPPQDFAQTCNEECSRYLQLLRGQEKDFQEAAKYIRALADLDVDSSLPLLLSTYSVLSLTDLAKVAQRLLVFVVRYLIVGGLDASGFETVVYALAREVREKKADPYACLSHVKAVLKNKSPDDDQLAPNVPKFILEDYEAAYMVERIASRMQSAAKEFDLGEANLEHVFPKKPSDEWTKKDELEPFLWHIGNLTILGTKMNNTVGNKGYATKKDYYLKNSKITMTLELANSFKTWEVASITERAKGLTKYVKEIWNFDNTSRV